MVRVALSSWWRQSVRIVESKTLVCLSVILVCLKSLELLIDHQAIFFVDSAAYILNGVGLHYSHRDHSLVLDVFFPSRSPIYGWTVRVVGGPTHSFTPVVVLQATLGGITAWLLAFMLLRYFRLRPGLALAAAIIFALDPVQIVHEHLILPESIALLCTACLLTTALQFFQTRALIWLPVLAVAGVGLVSLRIVYVPIVLLAAVMVPVMAYLPDLRKGGLRRDLLGPLALALLVSCLATAFVQYRYCRFIGRFARSAPAYSYDSGVMLLGNVVSLVSRSDSTDPRVIQAIDAQQASAFPLTYENRQIQLWRSDGLVARLRAILGNDPPALDRVCGTLARNAIRRHPLAFLRIGIETYADYWRTVPKLSYSLPFENGRRSSVRIEDVVAATIARRFNGLDIRTVDALYTPSRRYHEALADWSVLLLVAWPFLLGAAFFARPANPLALALFFCWFGLLFCATCMGSVAVFRYLQPFSLPGLAACAILAERIIPTRTSPSETAA